MVSILAQITSGAGILPAVSVEITKADLGKEAFMSTSTEKKTATSAATAKKPTRKTPLSAVKRRSTKIVNPPEAVEMGPSLRKKELIDLVVERSGKKKRDVKPAVESALEILGEALADKRELVLPPFGRFKIKRAKDQTNGRVMVVQIKQSDRPAATEAAASADAPKTEPAPSE